MNKHICAEIYIISLNFAIIVEVPLITNGSLALCECSIDLKSVIFGQFE